MGTNLLLWFFFTVYSKNFLLYEREKEACISVHSHGHLGDISCSVEHIASPLLLLTQRPMTPESGYKVNIGCSKQVEMLNECVASLGNVLGIFLKAHNLGLWHL